MTKTGTSPRPFAVQFAILVALLASMQAMTAAPARVAATARRGAAVGRDYVLVTALQSNMEGYTAPGGVDPTIDTPDARIRFLDGNARGLDLLRNAAPNGLAGWTSPDGRLDRSRSVAPYLRFVPTSSNYPHITFHLDQLEPGTTYEVAWSVDDPAIQLLVKLDKGQSVYPSAGYTMPDPSRPRSYAARFVATGPRDTLTVAANSNTTPTGAKLFDLHDITVRPLTKGWSYPQAPEVPYVWADVAHAPALGTSPGMWVARTLLARGLARRVVILPTARGGTGLVGGPWDPDTPGERFTAAKMMLARAMADDPGAVPVLLMIGGEWDATVGVRGVPSGSQAYVDKMCAMVAGLRSIPGAAHMQAIMGSMVPEYIAAKPEVARIDAAQHLLPARIPGFTFVAMQDGYQKRGEPFHYTAAGARRIGTAMGDAVDPAGSRP